MIAPALSGHSQAGRRALSAAATGPGEGAGSHEPLSARVADASPQVAERVGCPAVPQAVRSLKPLGESNARRRAPREAARP